MSTTSKLFQVPVSVQATLTAFVHVQAGDENEALKKALQMAAEGKVRFDLDDSMQLKNDSFYCPDETEEGIFEIAQDTLAGVAGAYRVSLCDLGEDDDLLWADLDVSYPEEELPECVSAMSCISRDATQEDKSAFCQRIADLLNVAAPQPHVLSLRTLEHAFIQLAQGEQTAEAYEKVSEMLEKARTVA